MVRTEQGNTPIPLPLLEYNSGDTLVSTIERKVVNPALEKAQEVRRQKAAAPVS